MNHVAEEKIVQEKAATSSYPPSSCLHTDLSQTKERMVFSKVWQVAMDRTMYKIINYLPAAVVTWYGIIGRRGLPNPGRSSTRVHIIVPCRAVPCRTVLARLIQPCLLARYGTARHAFALAKFTPVPCRTVLAR